MDVEQRAFEALRRITRATDLHSRSLLREFELTGPQLAILKEVARHREAPIGVLAKAAYMGSPTVTGIVDRLERQGWVRRTRSLTDRRQVFVTMTEAGRALVDRDPPLLSAGFRSRLLRLPEAEQQQICDTLGRVADMTEEAPAGKSDADSAERAPVAQRHSANDDPRSSMANPFL